MSEALLAAFTEWLDEDRGFDAPRLAQHAKAFLLWRGAAPLDTLTNDDILTFLLDWCPRTLALSAENADEMRDAIVEFCLFLGWCGYLRGGDHHGRSLARRANTLGRAMRTAIAEHADSSEALPQRSMTDLAEVDVGTLMVAMNTYPAEQHSTLLTAWKPHLTPSEKAGIVAAWIIDSTDAGSRLVGLKLLGMFEPAVAEPFMRQLLDSAAAGHAATWLIDHGLADGDAVGRFITPAIMVDILSQLVDYPDLLCEQFVASHDPQRMLDFFWSHPAPETATVLDILGHHLSDRALAKQARTAGFKHRSWRAQN